MADIITLQRHLGGAFEQTQKKEVVAKNEAIDRVLKELNKKEIQPHEALDHSARVGQEVMKFHTFTARSVTLHRSAFTLMSTNNGQITSYAQ